MIVISGGSFDYLYRNDVDELWKERRQLFKLISCLYVYGYEEAADEFKQFFKAVDKAYNPYRDDKPASGLSEWWNDLKWVAKSLEWWRSGDIRQDQFRKEWNRYDRPTEDNDQNSGEGR